MVFDFRYPMITATTEKEQLAQMKTYIHQLVDELKWALNSVDSSQGNYVVVQPKVSSGGISTIGLDDDSTQARFNELKPLIIKSAEIIEAYYEEINRRLEGIYVAQSDFGTFAEKTSQEIEETSTNTTQQFKNLQVVITDIDNNVGSLADTLLDISEEFSYTQRDIVDINSNIKVIGEDVENLSGSVSVLDGDIKAVGETVGAIDTELKVVESSVSGLGEEIQTVGSNVGELIDSAIGQMSDEVGVIDSDLQGVKESVDRNIKDISADIGNLDTKIDDTKSAIDSDIDKLKKSLDGLNSSLVEVSANIKSGLLYYDENEIPVYGLEIGQKNVIDGVEVFNQFARFKAGRLSFYDSNGIEVAYISDRKLYILDIEVLGSIKRGGLKEIILPNGDIVEKWVGRG